MSTGAIVAIVVVVIVVAALIAVAAFGARRRRLQKRFGPEYDRAVEGSDSRLKAEAELAERERRVSKLDIHPLNPAARDRYAAQWTGIQQQFVDSPAAAVTGAQTLITSVMEDRGYPTDDASQITADLSVEHASTIDQFRTAQELSSRAADGSASTEDLRQAMVHYRALFRELLGDSAAGAGYRDETEGSVPAEYPADETPVGLDDPDGEVARAAAQRAAAQETAAQQDAAARAPAATTRPDPMPAEPATVPDPADTADPRTADPANPEDPDAVDADGNRRLQRRR
jgi:Tfp pilus assembly protein PilX